MYICIYIKSIILYLSTLSISAHELLHEYLLIRTVRVRNVCKLRMKKKKPVTKGRKAKVTLTIIHFCHKMSADILKSNAQALKCCRSYCTTTALNSSSIY